MCISVARLRTWDCGRSRRPAFPAPSDQERDNEICKTRAKTSRGNAKLCSNSFPHVIPGRRVAASPESITTIVSMDSGPAPKGASRNDELFDNRICNRAGSQRAPPIAYGFSIACIIACVGVGMPNCLPSSTTLPLSHGTSRRLPRSRSSAIEAFMVGGK